MAEAGAFTECDAFDFRLPILGGLTRVEGQPVISIRSNHEELPVLSWRGDHFEIGFDLWATLGGLLHDAVHPGTSKGFNMSTRPTVDLLEDKVFAPLTQEFGARHSVWPRGSRFALGLSHDVDRIRKTFQQVTHSVRAFKQGQARRALHLALGPGRHAYWCFPRIMAMERQLGVRSTFFFLHEVPDSGSLGIRNRILLSGVCRLDDPRIRGIVPELHEGGWEIGLHSSTFARDDVSRLVREKHLLEGLTGQAVKGVRQHYLDSQVSRLWPLQREAGFDYDSTMGYSTGNGFRAGTCFPFPVGPEGALCQIPFEIMDGALRPSAESWSDCLRIMRHVEAVGGVLVLLWHQRFFNTDDFPGYAEVYRKLVAEAIRRNAWIAPLGDVIQAWRGMIR